MKHQPCEFCEGDLITIRTEDETDWTPSGTDLVIELYPGRYMAAIATVRGADEELGDITAAVPMRYCPNCGRKLE